MASAVQVLVSASRRRCLLPAPLRPLPATSIQLRRVRVCSLLRSADRVEEPRLARLGRRFPVARCIVKPRSATNSDSATANARLPLSAGSGTRWAGAGRRRPRRAPSAAAFLPPFGKAGAWSRDIPSGWIHARYRLCRPWGHGPAYGPAARCTPLRGARFRFEAIGAGRARRSRRERKGRGARSERAHPDANAAQARSVLVEAGGLETLAAHAIVILIATCAPADATALASDVIGPDRRFIDAPVLGGVVGATGAR
jgi:NAD binding domain of 6-phosphogluconate dehydrogenase